MNHHVHVLAREDGHPAVLLGLQLLRRPELRTADVQGEQAVEADPLDAYLRAVGKRVVRGLSLTA